MIQIEGEAVKSRKNSSMFVRGGREKAKVSQLLGVTR